MTSLPQTNLAGSLVRLVPLTVAHAPALLQCVRETVRQDDTLFGWTIVPRSLTSMETYIQQADAGRAGGSALPFAIVLLEGGRIVGTTRFAFIEWWAWPENSIDSTRKTPDACEIGFTWLAQSAIRTGVNTQAKRLLLTHAFEAWNVHRVSFRTDMRNARSRAAIERIGARFEGIIRCDRPATDGGIRDSARYSIVRGEWPSCRAELLRREASPPPD